MSVEGQANEEGVHRQGAESPMPGSTSIGRIKTRPRKSVPKDSSRIGYLSELFVVSRLIRMEYEVLAPLIPQSRTDYWIRCDGDTYAKLQIKTVRRRYVRGRGSEYRMWLTTQRRENWAGVPYRHDEVDFFVGVYKSKIFIVPIALAYPGGVSRPQITLGSKYLNAWHLLPKPYSQTILN